MYGAKSVYKRAVKNLSTVIFWQRVHRWQKSSQSLKTPAGGRAEIKNVRKMNLTFSISALPLEVTFQLWVDFSHLWTLCQKRAFRFLTTCVFNNNRNIDQNVKEGWFWTSIASILRAQVFSSFQFECPKFLHTQTHIYTHCLTFKKCTNYWTQLDFQISCPGKLYRSTQGARIHDFIEHLPAPAPIL